MGNALTRIMLVAICITAGQGQAQEEPKIQKALHRARPALLKHLKQTNGALLALCCLAAVHDGVPSDNRAFSRACKKLSRAHLRGTYGAALRLMVMAEMPAFPDREDLLQGDVETLLRNRAGGGFTYAKRNSWWDLSNTQYAALGLRAGESMGAEIDAEIWQKTLNTVLQIQDADGGFGYSRDKRRKHAYSSMTVAGVAVLQVCQQMLGAKLPKEQQAKVSQAVDKAWLWMAAHKEDMGYPQASSCLYFHYGLERAAILCDRKLVGGRNWYEVGADMLLQMQQKTGAWRSSYEYRPGGLEGPGSPVDTAFAMLFLRRKFQKVQEPSYVKLQSLGIQSSRQDVTLAVSHLLRQGKQTIPEVLKALRSPVTNRRRAAALALQEFAGGVFGYDPELPPTESAAAIKLAEQWWFKQR